MTVPIRPVAADATAALPTPVRSPGLLDILKEAEGYLARGEDKALVDQFVQEQTGGKIQSVAALRAGTSVSASNVGRAGLMGASFGFLDELIGAMALQGSPGQTPPDVNLPNRPGVGPGPLGRYVEGRDAIRKPYDVFREAHPVVSGGAEIAGGLAVPLGVAGDAARAPMSVGKALLRGARTGAIAGGVAGAGYNEDPSRLFQDIGTSALLGGALGAGFSAGGEGVARMRGSRAGARMSRALNDVNPDELRATEAARRAMGYGEINTVADLHPRMRAEADFAAQSNPAVMSQAEKMLESRSAGQSQRLVNGMDDVLGGLPDAEARRAQLDAARREIGSGPGGYEDLGAQVPQIKDPRLNEFLQRPVVRRAFERAKDEGLIAGNDELVPSFRILNSLRKQLQAQAESNWKNLGGNKELARALSDATDHLTSILSDNVPEFADLQMKYRGTMDNVRAFEAGIEDVKRESVRDLQRRLGNYSPAEKENFRYAVASGLVDELTAVQTNRNAAARYLNASPDLEAKLKLVFGTEDNFNKFMQRVETENEFRKTNSVVHGSQTYGRLQNANSVDPLDIGLHAAVGHGSGLMKVARAGLRFFGSGANARANSAAAAEIGPQLLTPGHSVDDVIRWIQVMQARRQGGSMTRTVLPSTAGLLSGR